MEWQVSSSYFLVVHVLHRVTVLAISTSFKIVIKVCNRAHYYIYIYIYTKNFNIKPWARVLSHTKYYQPLAGVFLIWYRFSSIPCNIWFLNYPGVLQGISWILPYEGVDLNLFTFTDRTKRSKRRKLTDFLLLQRENFSCTVNWICYVVDLQWRRT